MSCVSLTCQQAEKQAPAGLRPPLAISPWQQAQLPFASFLIWDTLIPLLKVLTANLWVREVWKRLDLVYVEDTAVWSARGQGMAEIRENISACSRCTTDTTVRV